MVRDIRRAGFLTDNAESYSGLLKANPFFQTANDLTIHDFGNGEDNCILYSYNRDNDKPPATDADERYGFRLNDDGELEMRRSGTTNMNCTNTEWQSITEPDVIITGLTFTIVSNDLNATSMTQDTNSDGCYDGDNNCNFICDEAERCNGCNSGEACQYIRDVTIALTGRLRHDQSSVPQNINEQIRIRNDKFVEGL
jgi:type IV pilus assembly protein PilW